MLLEFQTQFLDNAIRKTATLTLDQGDPISVWVEIPSCYAECMPDNDDAGLLLMLHPIMQRTGSCRIKGKIHRSLLENLEEYMRCWSCWDNAYHVPQLMAEEELEDPLPDKERNAVCSFSGGVDACFSIVSHRKGMWGHGNYNIKLAIMIHGADIPLEDESGFEQAFLRSKRMTDAWRIPLVPIKTNYRAYPHDWEHTYFSVVCACLSFFGNTYRHGVLGSCQRYSCDMKFPWGENPVTDHFLSTTAFAIHPCGNSVGRSERCGVIRDEPAVLKNLRVCWEGKEHGENCGVCEKCLRTQLNFMVWGASDLQCMPVPFSLEAFRQLKPWHKPACSIYQDILDINGQTHCLPEDIERTIQTKLKESRDILEGKTLRRKHHSLWWHIRHLKF